MASAVEPSAPCSELADRLNDEIERDTVRGLTPTSTSFETLSKLGAQDEPMILSPTEVLPHPELDRPDPERVRIASIEPEERKTKMDHDQGRALSLINGSWKPTDTLELRGQETVDGSLPTSKLEGVWIKSDKHHHLWVISRILLNLEQSLLVVPKIFLLN